MEAPSLNPGHHPGQAANGSNPQSKNWWKVCLVRGDQVIQTYIFLFLKKVLNVGMCCFPDQVLPPIVRRPAERLRNGEEAFNQARSHIVRGKKVGFSKN